MRFAYCCVVSAGVASVCFGLLLLRLRVVCFVFAACVYVRVCLLVMCLLVCCLCVRLFGVGVCGLCLCAFFVALINVGLVVCVRRCVWFCVCRCC